MVHSAELVHCLPLEKVGGQALGHFVSKPFRSWMKASQQLKAHPQLDYHLSSMTQMSEFVHRLEHPAESINTNFNTESLKRIEENQEVVEALLKIVMLCGRQGLSLRGHRDDEVDWTEHEEQQAQNQGNFVELVRFRAETDYILRRHLEHGPRNGRYTSKTI